MLHIPLLYQTLLLPLEAATAAVSSFTVSRQLTFYAPCVVRSCSTKCVESWTVRLEWFSAQANGAGVQTTSSYALFPWTCDWQTVCWCKMHFMESVYSSMMLFHCVCIGHQAGSCLIGGNCYVAEESNPQQPMERCDPWRNPTDWTETGELYALFFSSSCILTSNSRTFTIPHN